MGAMECHWKHTYYHTNTPHSIPVGDNIKTEMKETREINGREYWPDDSLSASEHCLAAGSQSFALHIAYPEQAQFYVDPAW